MNEEEFVQFVKAIARDEAESLFKRVLAVKEQIQQDSDTIDYSKLDEEDYVAANLTNLSTKRDVIERKAAYIPRGLAEQFAVCEAIAQAYPKPVSNRLIQQIRITTHYGCSEEGRALADFNIAISKSGRKYYPHEPVTSEEEEGGGFV